MRKSVGQPDLRPVDDGHSHWPTHTEQKPPYHCAECGVEITHEAFTPWKPIKKS